MTPKFDDISFEELLGYSIKGEETAYSAYMEISNKLSGLASSRFKSIAKEELDHKQKLLELHKHEFGDEEYVLPEGKDLPPHEGDFVGINTDKVTSLLEALESAIEAEKEAYDLYYTLAQKEEKHSELFNYIAVMERGHQLSLEEEKEMYEDMLNSAGEDLLIDELDMSKYR